MNRKKLEAVFESFANGNEDAARALLHDYIVETARDLYAEAMDDEMAVEDFAQDDDMTYGGDAKEDFADEIEASDEEGDIEVDGEEVEVEDEAEALEDRVEDLESSLDSLKAEFERLLNTEEGEHGVDFDGDGDIGDDEAVIKEATEFLKKVSISMKDEGQEAGDGKKVPVNTDNTFARGKKDTSPAGRPVDFAGGDEKGRGKVAAKDAAAEDNVDVKPGKAPKAEEKPVHDDNVNSLFTKKVK